jgi:NAD(P)-dependent dehydrogenase (short-subunit alcohol dehydrogenase family)
VALAESGFDLGLTWHREEDRANDAAGEIERKRQRCALRHLDLHAVHEGAQAFDELPEKLGGVHVLINNAGYGTSKPFIEMSRDEWQAVLDVNLTGAFLAAQAAARRMIDQGTGGAIINVTSVHEHIPLSGSAPYTASKHGLGGKSWRAS